jgi:glucuronoarabinoxylan endo-1,4-beta-xylanase
MSSRSHATGEGAMRVSRAATLCFLGLLAGMPVHGAVITLDEAATYQTIEGFGGFGPMKVWWGSTPYYNDNFVDLMINDLGLTMLRTTVSASFEYTNDNADPAVTDLGAYNITSRVPGDAETHLGDHFPFYRAIQAEADAQGVPLKVISSIWTPPAWMKTNNDIRNGGNLRDDMRDEFAEYCAAYVKTIKAQTGIDIYAFNIQNEPVFVEPYESCVYSNLQYRDALKVVAARFEQDGLATKFFLPEDVDNRARVTSFVGPACSDATIVDQVGALAVHSYQPDAVTPGSPGANDWANYAALADNFGISVWMTETSGWGSDWSGSFDLAKGVFGALKYGKLSAWVMWYTCDNLMAGTGLDKRGYAMKQFYRYIRPGAVMIDCGTDDDDVPGVAFIHPEHQTLTIVLLNLSGQTKDVGLTGVTLPAMQAYRTSAGENCVAAGTVSGSTVSLPASSVTTLYGAGYSVGTTAPAAPPRVAPLGRDGPARVVDLSGRAVVGRGAEPHAVRTAGVYVAVPATGRRPVLRAELSR